MIDDPVVHSPCSVIVNLGVSASCCIFRIIIIQITLFTGTGSFDGNGSRAFPGKTSGNFGSHISNTIVVVGFDVFVFVGYYFVRALILLLLLVFVLHLIMICEKILLGFLLVVDFDVGSMMMMMMMMIHNISKRFADFVRRHEEIQMMMIRGYYKLLLVGLNDSCFGFKSCSVFKVFGFESPTGVDIMFTTRFAVVIVCGSIFCGTGVGAN